MYTISQLDEGGLDIAAGTLTVKIITDGKSGVFFCTRSHV